jgi:hypothetical protein
MQPVVIKGNFLGIRAGSLPDHFWNCMRKIWESLQITAKKEVNKI